MSGVSWLGILALALAAGAIAVALRQAMPQPGNLVGSAMRRLGITPADAEAAGLEQALDHAKKRCGTCLLQEKCRRRLRSLRRGLPEDCPNTELFSRISRDRAAHQLTLERRRVRLEAWQSPPLM